MTCMSVWFKWQKVEPGGQDYQRKCMNIEKVHIKKMNIILRQSKKRWLKQTDWMIWGRCSVVRVIMQRPHCWFPEQMDLADIVINIKGGVYIQLKRLTSPDGWDHRRGDGLPACYWSELPRWSPTQEEEAERKIERCSNKNILCLQFFR